MSSYKVEPKDGNYVILDKEGNEVGEPYTTRRAAIRELGKMQKFEKTIKKDHPKETEGDDDDESEE